MVREILIWPHPGLKKKAAPVKKVTAATRKLVADLFDTMAFAEGVGLAATQVGVLQRVIVLDIRCVEPKMTPLAMINPELLELEGELTYAEGCLSIPGETEDVDRAAWVRVKFLDVQGRPRVLSCEGLLAVAVQHETDHLHGTLFVDHLSIIKRAAIRKRMKRLKAARAGPRPSGPSV